MPLLIFIFTIILSCQTIFGQTSNYPIKNFSINNGLITNNIYCVFRDSKGLMWYGTDRGLLQFDGTTFKSYTIQDGLPDNEIFNFCEDHQGRIWMATLNGNMGYYYLGRFYSEQNNPELYIPNHPSYIYYIGLQSDSSLLFFYHKSNFIAEYSKGQFKHFYIPDIYFNPANHITHVKKIEPEVYCIIGVKTKILFSKNQVIEIDTTEKMLGYCYNNKVYNIQDNSVYEILNCSQVLVHKLDSSNLYRYTFYKDNLNYYYEGTTNGLNIYKQAASTEHINILKDCKVSSINQDIEGNYWIGTLNKGIFYLPKGYEGITFTDLSSFPKISNMLKIKKTIYLFAENRNVYKFQGSQKPELFLDLNSIKNNLNNSTKYQIFADSSKIILGADVNIIIPLGLSKKNVAKSFKLNNYIKDMSMVGHSIVFHNNSHLCFINNSFDINNYNSFPVPDHQRIFDISSKDQNILVATARHFYTFSNDTFYAHPELNGVSLFKFILVNNTIIGITQNYELAIGKPIPNSIFYNWQFIKEQCTWINLTYILNHKVLLLSNKGYYILHLNFEEPVLSPSENVLLPNFPQEILCDSPYVYFLSVDNKITKIHHSTILAKPISPTLIIKSFQAQNNYLEFTNPISLDFNDSRQIRIEFTGVGFNRRKINYQVAYDNDEWINVDEPIFNLLNPAAGNHVIKFRCKSESSNYGIVKMLHFSIRPVWYAQWWFSLLALSVLVALIYVIFIFIIRHNNRIREVKHLEEIRFQQAEFRSLNALMNPHFIFNSLNNIQYLINDNKKWEANEYLSIFSNLIRQNMENINKDLISLEKEMILVKNYLLLEQLRFKEKLVYEISNSPQSDLSTIMVPPLLIQPLVENAIKHGILQTDKESGKIWIQINEQDDSVKIVIRNIGPHLNFEKTNQGLQQSLLNIKSRLSKLEIVHHKTFHLVVDNFHDEKERISGVESIITISS